MKKILIVDDDHSIVSVVTMILHNEGYSVDALYSGEDLTNNVKTSRPDLILLDIALGLLDGRDLCNLLKSDPEISHIPVILFSALNGYFVTEELRCHPDDVLAKPFEVKKLIETVSKHINN